MAIVKTAAGNKFLDGIKNILPNNLKAKKVERAKLIAEKGNDGIIVLSKHGLTDTCGVPITEYREQKIPDLEYVLNDFGLNVNSIENDFSFNGLENCFFEKIFIKTGIRNNYKYDINVSKANPISGVKKESNVFIWIKLFQRVEEFVLSTNWICVAEGASSQRAAEMAPRVAVKVISNESNKNDRIKGIFGTGDLISNNIKFKIR